SFRLALVPAKNQHVSSKRRPFQNPAHVNDVPGHPKILDLSADIFPSWYQYLGHMTPDASCRRRQHLGVLPFLTPRRRGTRWHGWMQFARCGFTLPFDGLFRLGTGRTTASASRQRAAAVGAILPDEKSPLPRLGLGPAGPGDV